jgi:hypothetical protein
MLTIVKKNELNMSQIEKFCNNHFTVSLKINKVLINSMPTSNNSFTTVFTTNNHAVYALCSSDDLLELADIKKIVKLAGMKAESYLPPHADKDYFIRHGRNVFLSVFPGRKTCTPQETAFYQTLTPYNPALVKIERVNGELRQYNIICEKWQKALVFSYLRMQVR